MSARGRGPVVLFVVVVVFVHLFVARVAVASPDGGTDAESDVAGDVGPRQDAALEAPRLAILRARVVAKGTREALPGASITVDAVPAGETDAGGWFELRVAPGPHHVDVQYPRFDVVSRRIDVTDGMPDEIFRLPPRLTGEKYETTIKAPPTGAPRIAVSGEEARKTAGTSGDPLRVIASLPGVSQVLWPAAVYVVRGANPGNTGYFLDGMRVPALFHLALAPSIIHPYLVAEMEFYPGGFPASYGGSVGGVVGVRTAPPPADRARASADVTFYDAGGIVTAPWHDGRGTVAVAGRYSFTGPLMTLLQADTSFSYGDYQLRVDHAAAGGQATLFAFGSFDHLGSTVPGADDYAALQFHRLDARWRGPVGGGRLLVAVNGGIDRAQSTLFTRPIKVRALSVSPRLAYERHLGAAVDLLAGADALVQDFTTEVPLFQPRQSDLGRPREALSQGTFATFAVRVGRLLLSPGLRADLFVEQGTHRFELEPRLDARLALTDATALKLTAGRFAQMATLPVNVAGFESFGLRDLGVQTSLGGSLGVEATFPRLITASVTGYGQRLHVTDVRNIDFIMPDPAAPDFLVSRRGIATGVELLVRRADLGRAFGWLAYTLSWSLREDDNGVLGRGDWDQRHLLNLVAGYRLTGATSVGARFHYATGRYAPIYDSGGQYRELPAFYQLDLRADHRFLFDRFILYAYIDIANATFTRSVFELRSGADSVTLQPRVLEASYQIALPTVGLHAQF